MSVYWVCVLFRVAIFCCCKKWPPDLSGYSIKGLFLAHVICPTHIFYGSTSHNILLWDSDWQSSLYLEGCWPMARVRDHGKIYIGSYGFCLETIHITARDFSLAKTSYIVSPDIIGTEKYNLSTGRGSKYLRMIKQSVIILSKYFVRPTTLYNK